MKKKVNTGLQNLLRKKELLFWGLLLLVGVIAIVYFAFLPLVGSVINAGKESSRLGMRLKDSKTLIASFGTLQEDNKKHIQALEEHKRQMAGEDENSKLLEVLLEASKKSEVDFISLRPGKVKDKGRYIEFPFEMTVRTQFPSLVKFIKTLEKEGSLVRIGELSIAASKTQAGEIEARLEATSLFVK